jgi:hypothetical protein
MGNLYDKDFRSKELTEKKLVGVALLLPPFQPHQHGHFWPFLTIQSQGIETMLFILKVL